MTPPEPAAPAAPGHSGPSIVGLIGVALDAELAALAWLLVEGGIPLVVAVPPGRDRAGLELAHGILASVLPDPAGADALTAGLDRPLAWALVHGHRPGAVVVATSLEDLRNSLAQPPIQLSEQELSFLGCVFVLEAPEGRPTGRLRVTAAHYVRPLARDAHGHAQLLQPAVLATWDARLGRYEHFAWGVLPEIAARLGRRAGDLEADLHHRRDDLAGLVTAKLTELGEVRRLIAGYRVGYGHAHGARED